MDHLGKLSPLFAQIPPERALQVLTERLQTLDKLRGRRYKDAEEDEALWEKITETSIESAFGQSTEETRKFAHAKTAGTYSYGGMSPDKLQANFEARIRAMDALLQGLIHSLKLRLPETIKGVYDAGDEYGFYRDLSALVQAAKKDVFFVDAYINEEIFNLYVSKVSSNTAVRILTNQARIGVNVELIAKKYANARPLSLRSSNQIHDRHVFIDSSGWVIGQSFEDAGKTKPTYLIELNEPGLSALTRVPVVVPPARNARVLLHLGP